jgi:hypothetical protein
MDKLLFGFFGFVLIALALNSCTVEKRVHQDGYHISWKHKHAAASEIKSTQVENPEAITTPPVTEESTPNVHSSETLSASNSEDIVILPQKRTLTQSKKDTVIPDQQKSQEEYFSNNYTNALPTNELQDTKLANWALGLGIASISAPVWGLLLFLLIVGILGASWSSIGIWTALGAAFLVGGAIFITAEILAITFAVRFLRMHAKDPNYRKYRSRAITALILAGIYPALIVLNILVALAAI